MTMLRSWIAVAVLAGSWMFGLGYFYPADFTTWAIMIAAGALLLYGTKVPLPSPREMAITVVLLLPVVIWTPWPYAIIPSLLLFGLLVEFLPVSLRWLKSLGEGILAASGILLVQALMLALYTAKTARSHELIWPLPEILAAVARLFSVDAAFDGVNIVFRTMRQTHRLAPTWELFFDPVTCCFLFGGLFFLSIKIFGDVPPGERWSRMWRSLCTFTGIVLVWLPFRAGLLIAIYVHRVVNSDPERSLYVMNHIFAPWPLLLYAVVPTLLAWRFIKISGQISSPLPLAGTTQRSGPAVRAAGKSVSLPRFLALLLVSASVAMIFTLAVEWSPLGKRKEGKVAVVERHSAWEPTDKPYDTTWYGEAMGYNYAALYAYLDQYYKMSRINENDKIDDATLAKCDVLVIKTPTSRYSSDEVRAVLKFVQRGGGVLFIGDHTNLDGMATTMNDMTRPMGFIFRDDLLFTNERTKIRTLENVKEDPLVRKDRDFIPQDESVSLNERTCYHQRFVRSWPPHPVVQHMPPMEFAVSCSIDPGLSSGQAVMCESGLWSMPPDYHMSNYHPIPRHCAPMRYGAFVQLWATYYDDGRAMAFTDSTIFSNACAYQPGHAELFRDMIEWLNHENPTLAPQLWLILLGIAVLAMGVWFAASSGFQPGTIICFIAAGLAGWIGGCELTAILHRANMPPPQAIKPMPRVVIDRTISAAPLFQCFFRRGENGTGFGLMEQWIAKLNCYTIRQEGKESFSGDALVVVCPTLPVSPSYREELIRYVNDGGKLLVFDSPENQSGTGNNSSTANSLLEPFGIKIQNSLIGSLILKESWPDIPANACEITGGEAIARINGKPVAAVTHPGKGTVMVVGFGNLFNDRNMGYTWMVDPNAEIKQRFNVFYALVRSLLENKPLQPTKEAFGNKTPTVPSPDVLEKNRPKAITPHELPELPAEEMGVKG